MFSNLLYQDKIVGRLKTDLTGNAFPPSVLFSGDAMCGKFTAALETARILCCHEDASWQCTCFPCRQHRVLNHPYTIIAGNRDLSLEIAACADVLSRHDSTGSRFLMIRSVRKLIRRFDPVLWDGEETRNSRMRTVMERLYENIASLVPDSTPIQGGKLKKKLKALVEDCEILQTTLPALLPIAQVRRIRAWSLHSAGKEHKTIILDAADRMSVASQNALLKFLEEPHGDTSIILISERKNLLLPTIISRLRDYSFFRRSPEQEAEVLRRVFHQKQNHYANLSAYFNSWKKGSSQSMQELAEAFLSNRHYNDIPELESITDHSGLIAFLGTLSMELRRRWKQEHDALHRKYFHQMQQLRNARIRAETLNLPVQLILRSLHGSLGDML